MSKSTAETICGICKRVHPRAPPSVRAALQRLACTGTSALGRVTFASEDLRTLAPALEQVRKGPPPLGCSPTARALATAPPVTELRARCASGRTWTSASISKARSPRTCGLLRPALLSPALLRRELLRSWLSPPCAAGASGCSPLARGVPNVRARAVGARWASACGVCVEPTAGGPRATAAPPDAASCAAGRGGPCAGGPVSRYPPSLPRGASDGGGAACVEASLPMPLWHCRFFLFF